MSRIITREDTKRLVRGLEKSVPKERAEEFGEYYLYYNGDKGFFWFKEGEQPEWTESLRVSKRLAYREQRDGSLRRDNLGELDELFYKYINSSRFAIAHKKIVDFETKGVFKLNRELKVLRVRVDEIGGVRYLQVGYRVNDKPSKIKNERLQGINGDMLTIAFYMHMEDTDNPIRGLDNKSSPEELRVILTDEYLSQWGDFIEGIKSFDKELVK